MSNFSRSIPGLFGGVSQQIPAMRLSTQGDVQENATTNITDGLTKRNGLAHLANLLLTNGPNSVDGADGNVHTHWVNRGATRQVLLVKNGNLMVYDRDTGSAVFVATPDGTTYLNTPTPESSIKCLTVADYTFILNTDKVVGSSTTDTFVNDPRVAYVVVQQAVASIAFGVVVDGVNCPYSSAAATDTAAISAGLAASVSAQFPTYTVEQLFGTMVRITKPTGTISVQTADGFGNQSIYCLNNGVPKYSQLPVTFVTGFVITVTNTADSQKDNFYVKWDGTKYIECKKPGIVDTIDPLTMPHQLIPQSDGSFRFQKVTWGMRLVGDDNSNPLPSFIGNTLRNLVFHRNRFGLLSEDSIILSKAGQYYDFFAGSGQAVLDSDPIDLASPSTKVVYLDAAVPFAKDLLLQSTNQQFILTAGDILSPKTAKIVGTTSFENYPTCEPKSLGNRLVFTTNKAGYSTVSFYQVSINTVTNERLDISEHIPRYIPASPLLIATSEMTKNIAVVSSQVRNELFMFKYAEDDALTKLTQKAWGKLVLSNTGTQQARILSADWDNSRLYLAIHYKDTQDSSSRYCLEMLDLQHDVTDMGLPFYLCLDRKVVLTSTYDPATDTSSVTVPYWEKGVLQAIQSGVGTVEPQPLSIKAVSYNSNGTMLVTLYGDTSAATVWIGKQFTFRWVFSEFVFTDKDGVPIQNMRLRMKQMRLKYTRSGAFRVNVTPYLRPTYTYAVQGKKTGVLSLGLGQSSVSDGELLVPVGTRPDGLTCEIVADSYFPCTFPYAEWSGDVVLRAQR